MKTSEVVGRRIVSIRQSRIYDEHCGGGWIMALEHILLDDGTRIDLDTRPTENLPVVVAKAVKV